MFYPRLFWKLFSIYAGFQLATVIAFVVLVFNWQESQTFVLRAQRLGDAAKIMRGRVLPQLRNGDTGELRQTVDALAAETQMRITLVRTNGVVIADSEEDATTMENHSNREELREAMQQGHGSSRRLSPTIQIPMLYHAARVDNAAGEPLGLIRVSVPLSELEAEVASIRNTMWFVASLVSLFGLLATYAVVARTLSPVERLTGAVNAMAEGDYAHRVSVTGRDELAVLAQSFNRMGSEIEARENELRDAADRMKAVFGGMVEGVLAVDNQRRILFANAAAANLLEFALGRIEGRPMKESISNSQLRHVVKDHLAVADEPTDEEPRVVEINASDRVLAINGARLPGSPCPGVVLVMHDITDLRRLETLRQEFVANVSHELKTPLSSILAFAETLLRGALEDTENRARFVSHIEKQAIRLRELIQDMLSLARMEAGQEPYEIESVNVATMVANCLREHSPAAAEKNIHLEGQLEGDSVSVQADEEALRQILDNLVSNAIKYTADGGRVHVGWKVDGEHVVLEVEDNGIGIPKKHLSRVFERFYRVDKARSREMGGTGLGLSIVKHLAQMQGGSVSLESEVGKGSTFRVRLAQSSPTGALAGYSDWDDEG